MSSSNARFRAVVYSDIHLGHRRIVTEDTADNLINDIKDDYEAMGGIDLIIIPGDLFDRHLPLHHPDSHTAAWFLSTLLSIAKDNKTMVRILEGTPGHDWKQSRLVDALKESMGVMEYVEYVEELSLEYNDKLGITILYLPDEWAGGPEEAWVEVKDILAREKLDAVDLIIMHGMFEYQLPPGVHAPFHLLERYQSICRLQIYCGHVHKHSTRERLVVPGSYDRLAHNEEHAKGHIRSIFSSTGEVNHTFVANKKAHDFKSIDVRGLTLDDFHDIMEELSHQIRYGANIRVQTVRSDAVLYNEKELTAQYPAYRWKVDYTDKIKHQMRTLNEDNAPYNAKPITPATIGPMVKELANEWGISNGEIDAIMEVLDQYVST